MVWFSIYVLKVFGFLFYFIFFSLISTVSAAMCLSNIFSLNAQVLDTLDTIFIDTEHFNSILFLK